MENKTINFLSKLFWTTIIILWSGFVFMRLWNWHIAYTFEIIELSWYQSVCVLFFIGYAKGVDIKKIGKVTPMDEYYENTVKYIIYLFIVFSFGWFLTLLR